MFSEDLKAQSDKIEAMKSELGKAESKLRSLIADVQIVKLRDVISENEFLAVWEKDILDLRNSIRDIKKCHREILAPQSKVLKNTILRK